MYCEELEEIARNIIGDGKSPDVFFVSVNGKVKHVSLDFKTAYSLWKDETSAAVCETALENRQYGVIACLEPEYDNKPNSRLVVIDDSETYRRNLNSVRQQK